MRSTHYIFNVTLTNVFHFITSSLYSFPRFWAYDWHDLKRRFSFIKQHDRQTRTQDQVIPKSLTGETQIFKEKKEEIRLSPMTKKPYTPEKSKKQLDYTKTPPKTSITQWLQTDLGRSVGVTTATQLVWLDRFTETQLPTHSTAVQSNGHDTLLVTIQTAYTKMDNV